MKARLAITAKTAMAARTAMAAVIAMTAMLLCAKRVAQRVCQLRLHITCVPSVRRRIAMIPAIALAVATGILSGRRGL